MEIPELKNTVPERGKKKKSVNGMNSTLGMVKEKTSELEERSVEFF